ncbi:MAG: dihydroneopterin aldolase [Rhodanobacter sp.]
MDTVFIEDLRIDAVIGAYAWEREIRQILSFRIEMAFDCRAAGTSDSLADALDYHAAASAITTLVQASSFQLLEALAERVAQMLLCDFAPSSVTVTLRKPGAVDSAGAVGVCIERRRTDA